MRFVDNRNITDPRLNLALEEFLLRHVVIDEPLFLFYVNEPSVIVGRNQNVLEEADLAYAKANGVHVVRRLSGGGAVYHDLGNLNFSFITNDTADLQNFTKFTDPIVQVLNRLGVPAEFRNKSDLFVAGKKISGNAQFSSRGRMLSHGTILFDSELSHLRQAIRPMKSGITSSAVQSNRSSVINIRDFLTADMSLAELKQAILQGIFESDQIPTYPLSEADWEQIGQMSVDRYQKWAWNIGGSPRFQVKRSGRFPVGEVQIQLEVYKGLIEQVYFETDAEARYSLQAFGEHIKGHRYDEDALKRALSRFDLRVYFGKVSVEEVLALIY